MDDYIQISKINDYLFCKYSLFLHSIYEDFDSSIYYEPVQYGGKFAHKNIDDNQYSSKKDILQGIPVYSVKYNIAGAIDLYDKSTKSLIERKKKVKDIYEGYKYQLYAQYLCLKEMHYPVKHMYIHSLDDNKKYEISIPNMKELQIFLDTINEMKNIKVEDLSETINPAKCKNCIYSELCTKKC